MTRVVVLVLLACLSSVESAAQTSTATTVILVRHAERETGQGDDPLSAQGRARAQVLAYVLRDANITTVMTSGVTRTRETAEPFARQAGLTSEVLPTEKLDDVGQRIRSRSGGAVLIVHHSNTVPVIAEKLGVSIAPIADQEFDRLIVLTLPSSGSPSAVTLRYGPPPDR
jgi:broad specificity phosphatase PhoE